MTKDEISLLLYFETRAVDHIGLVDTAHMNDEDMKIAKKWNDDGFVKTGRVAFEDAIWCELSDGAWEVVHRERKNRAKRMWEKRSWKKTEEL